MTTVINQKKGNEVNDLSDEAIEKVANAIIAKSQLVAPRKGALYSEKEKEWLASGTKYFPSEKFPLLGKIVKLLDDSAYEIGKWFLKMLFVSGMGGLLILVMHKLGVFK